MIENANTRIDCSCRKEDDKIVMVLTVSDKIVMTKWQSEKMKNYEMKDMYQTNQLLHFTNIWAKAFNHKYH